MSNIYNRRLDYEVFSNKKRVLERPEKTTVPKYAVVGNTQPNLDFQVNRMLQPLFSTKKPIPQSPYTPKQPVNASGLGGRAPIYIDYVIPDRPEAKKPSGLLWEPNSIRETRLNVWPDGVPKNLNQLQQADSQYLENLNNEKKQKQLQERYDQRSRAGGHDGSRPHPTPSVEEELKKLDDMLAEAKYGKGPFKNVGLNAEQHRQMAEKQAAEIRKELADLRASGIVKKGAPGGAPAVPVKTLSEDDLKELSGDPAALTKYVGDLSKIPKDENSRIAAALNYMLAMEPKLDIKSKQALDDAKDIVSKISKNTTSKKTFDDAVRSIYAAKTVPSGASVSPSISKRKPSKGVL